MKQPRNFWLEAQIDGRETALEGGPANGRGEFSQTIYIRSEGKVLGAVSITGQVTSEDKLVLSVEPHADVLDSRTAVIEHDEVQPGFQIETTR